MKLFLIRGYTIYASEEELIPIMDKFQKNFERNRDYINILHLVQRDDYNVLIEIPFALYVCTGPLLLISVTLFIIVLVKWIKSKKNKND